MDDHTDNTDAVPAAAMAAKPPSVSVIIPVYNEAGNLPDLVSQLRQALAGLDAWEVILINDGSSDGSTEVLDRLAGESSRFKVVHLSRNYGQTAAMMAGFDHSSGDVIVPMDGDLQNDPADIPGLLARLDDGWDVVSGWRRERRDTLRRRLPSRMANRLISWISGVRLNDYGCTLKAYRRDVLQDVRLYGEMHRFIPIYASWQGARVTEMAVNHRPRTRGTSKYGLERTFKVILDLLVVKFLSDYSQKPIHLFGGFGLFSIAAGFLCFGGMIYYKFWGGKTFIETPLPQLVIMLFLMGGVSILMGLQAEILMRTYYESQGKRIYQVRRRLNLDVG